MQRRIIQPIVELVSSGVLIAATALTFHPKAASAVGEEPAWLLRIVGFLGGIALVAKKGKEATREIKGLIRELTSLLPQGRAGRTQATLPSKPLAEGKPFRLTSSFDSGFWGGLIGGAMAGLVVGWLYYLGGKDKGGEGPHIILYIVLYGALTGTMIGACSQFAILAFRHLTSEKGWPALLFNELSGGVVGATFGATLAGALGGWIFGPRPGSFPDPMYLAPGVTVGAFFVAMGALFYDYEGRWRNILLAVGVLICITAMAVLVGTVVLQVYAFPIWDRFFAHVIPQDNLFGGALMGAILGIVMGCQVGGTILLYRLLKRLREPEPMVGAAAGKER
jgi:hypothetical protein